VLAGLSPAAQVRLTGSGIGSGGHGGVSVAGLRVHVLVFSCDDGCRARAGYNDWDFEGDGASTNPEDRDFMSAEWW